VALLALATSLSCRSPAPATANRPAPANGANLIVITLDTVRADHLGPYGYTAIETPALTRLASEGVRFAAAYASVPLTLPSHTSLFTGLLPMSHGVRDNGGFHVDPAHRTLAETLKTAGYRTAAFVSAFVLDSRWGLARGFDTYHDDFPVTTGDLAAMAAIQRPADATWTAARTWLDTHRSERFFAWIHFFDPHTPYAPPAPFQARYADRPYDGEIAYVDSVITQIIHYLEANTLLDTTTVLVVGDHGEGLGEHDEDEHGLLAYDTTLHVPWIVRLPDHRGAGRVISEPVGLVDVFPTVAGLLGIALPTEVDGIDRTVLIDGGSGDSSALYAETLYPRLRMGWSELTTIRNGDYKYIKAPQPELYNWRTDPQETTNLAAHEGGVVARLDRVLSGAVADRTAAAVRSNLPDPETVKQLQALGYVAGTTAPLSSANGLADPKTKTAAYRSLARARRELAEGQQAAGIRTLQGLVLAEPEFEVARRTLRDYWIGHRHFEEATNWLRMLAARQGGEPGVWRDLAVVGRASGDTRVARDAIDRALKIRPEDAESLIVAGEIQRDGGQLDAALNSFKRAAERAAYPTVAKMQSVQTLIALRKFAEAELLVRSVLATDPNTAGAHYLLAQIAEARNDPRTAEHEYRQEIERNPWEYRARFNLSLLVGARGARTEQIALLRSIPPLAPDFGEVYFYLAKALLDSGDANRYGEAAEAAERGLRLAPMAPSAPLGHYVLADIYQSTGRPVDAAREVERGRQLEHRLKQQGR
jgi:arylsulfatase A-like enzyme/tetratricopeptide (TPR) repeat protein